jgi:stage V sporulation protein D (sporulation-specific penicillin-binding protein)
LQAAIVIRKRIAKLCFLFGLFLCVLAGRSFWLQVVQGAELTAQAESNRTQTIPVDARRGIIYDRNQNELAISISTDSVYAIPARIKNEEAVATAQALADILQLDAQTVTDKLLRNSTFEWIKRQISPEQAETIQAAIKAEQLKGIDLTQENRRFYPKGTMAAHILGISGVDNTGLEGIDYYYNDLIGGQGGQIVIELDAAGREIVEATHAYTPPVNGANLVLTIDETIQHIAETQAEAIFTEFQCQQVAIIVMDPNNGEILAMVSQPTFDPNNYGAYPEANRRNYAINNAYEPGSTMKITTLAMALEEKVAGLDSYFDCNGAIKVGIETLRCLQNKAHGHQSLAQIFDNSCNVGFIQLGLSLGMENYYRYLNAFGFGRVTGVDLPGESTGLVVRQADARSVDLASMAMGQSTAVTPLQLLTAVSGLVNGGMQVEPHLVSRIVSGDGALIQEYNPGEPVRLVSEETSRLTRQLMEGEVINGTGKNAAIDGYQVGGKTGTAEKVNPDGKGYLDNEFVASFLGVAPVDNPRIAVLVVADAPQGYPYYGGTVCAPAAGQIMQATLQYLSEPLSNEISRTAPPDNSRVVPNVVALAPAEAASLLQNRGFTVKVEGEGDAVYQQTPRGGSRVDSGALITLQIHSFAEELVSGSIVVPDLYGKSMRETDAILSGMGLHLHPEGSGLVYEQIPEAGKTVSSGTDVRVRFRALE